MPVQNIPQFTPQFDLATEQGKLQRTRELAKAMLASSLLNGRDSPVIDTGMFKVANWGDPVGRLAEAISGTLQNKQADENERKLNTEVQGRTQDALRDYIKQRDGTPATPFNQGGVTKDDEGNTMPPIPGTEGNPREAAVRAMASQLPGMREVGKSDLDALNKNQFSFSDVLRNGHYYDPNTLAAAVALAQRGKMAEASAMLVGRTTSNVTDGVATPIQDGRPVGPGKPLVQFNPAGLDPGTGVPSQTQVGTGQTKALQGGNTTPQSVITEASARAAMDSIKDERVNIAKQAAMVPAMKRSLELVNSMNDNDFTTVGAFKLAANKVLNAAGLPSMPTEKGEELKALTQGEMQNILRLYAPVSNVDTKQAASSVGDLGINSKAGFQAVLTMAMANHQADVDAFHKRVAETRAGFGGLIPQGWESGMRIQAPNWQISDTNPNSKAMANQVRTGPDQPSGISLEELRRTVPPDVARAELERRRKLKGQGNGSY